MPKRGGGYVRNKGINECSFPDLLLSTFVLGIAFVEYEVEYKERLKEEGFERGTRGEAIYLGRKIEKGGLEVNRLFEEFRLIAKEISLLRF